MNKIDLLEASRGTQKLLSQTPVTQIADGLMRQ